MNHGVETEDSGERKRRTRRFKRFPELLMGGIKQNVDEVKYSARRASLEVCFGMVAYF